MGGGVTPAPPVAPPADLPRARTPPSISSVTIIRARRGEDSARWAAALADAGWAVSSTVLKHEGHAWVRAAHLRDRDVVIKCREVAGPWERFKAAIGRGKFDRHWRGAARLAARSIPTADVLVLAGAAVDGRAAQLLVMLRVAGESLLQLMADVHGRGPAAPGIREQHAIARAVGEQIAQMDDVFNRDHKPSNLIVSRSPGAAPRLALIDCEGVRRAAMPAAARMFASLLIEPTGCGVRPRQSLQVRALRAWLDACVRLDSSPPPSRADRRAALRTAAADIARIVAHHGNPVPRVDPLA